MLPNPLHPAIVHLPLALALLLPMFALGALLVARRNTRIRSVWAVVVGLHLLLAVSVWAATETGEAQEDLVEPIVTEAPLEEHEEAAERLLFLAIAASVLSVGGFMTGRTGQVGRIATTGVTVLLLAAATLVGHSGGELVYTHGAADAYVSQNAGTGDHGG